jgi:hypothetical protein
VTDLETLSEEERARLAWPMQHETEAKAVRIIDEQARRIDRARKILAEPRPVDSPEARLASDLREVLGE